MPRRPPDAFPPHPPPDDPAPLPDAPLRALAPEDLPRLREDRYTGQELGVLLEAFEDDDRRTLSLLYEALGNLLDLGRDAGDPRGALRAFARGAAWSQIVEAMRGFGGPTRARGAGAAVMRAVHDLRGGALTALAFELSMLDEASTDAEARALLALARDQMKISRNCVADVDPSGRTRDLLPRTHDVAQLVERWEGAPSGARRVVVDASYLGPVAESCVEFATLERAVYNLMNNALAHAADGRVRLSALGAPARDPASVRFVVANALRAEQRRALLERFGDAPGALFLGGFTTGGSGMGMRICAEVVAHAYGLGSIERGVDAGYVGARILGDRFVAWLHWPVAGDAS